MRFGPVMKKMLINWDLPPETSHPGPPRANTEKSKAALLAQMPFFCSPSSLTKASFRRFAGKQKKRNLNGCAFDFFVIRLGTENMNVGKSD